MNKQTMPRASKILYTLSDSPTLRSTPYTRRPASIFSTSPLPISRKVGCPSHWRKRPAVLVPPRVERGGEIIVDGSVGGHEEHGRATTSQKRVMPFISSTLTSDSPFLSHFFFKKNGGRRGRGGQLSQDDSVHRLHRQVFSPFT